MIGNIENNSNRIAIIKNEGKYFTIMRDCRNICNLSLLGEVIEINLKMEAKNLPSTMSRNVVAELRGSTNPEKVVVVSGHIDSWDVGQGAMDDGGGAFVSWQALKLLKHLNYRPRRTVR